MVVEGLLARTRCCCCFGAARRQREENRRRSISHTCAPTAIASKIQAIAAPSPAYLVAIYGLQLAEDAEVLGRGHFLWGGREEKGTDRSEKQNLSPLSRSLSLSRSLAPLETTKRVLRRMYVSFVFELRVSARRLITNLFGDGRHGASPLQLLGGGNLAGGGRGSTPGRRYRHRPPSHVNKGLGGQLVGCGQVLSTYWWWGGGQALSLMCTRKGAGILRHAARRCASTIAPPRDAAHAAARELVDGFLQKYRSYS